jgi:hypothetical protein
MGTGFDTQTPDVFQSRMFFVHDFFERAFQAIASDFHVPVQQGRDKELELLASETSVLLVGVCGKPWRY